MSHLVAPSVCVCVCVHMCVRSPRACHVNSESLPRINTKVFACHVCPWRWPLRRFYVLLQLAAVLRTAATGCGSAYCCNWLRPSSTPVKLYSMTPLSFQFLLFLVAAVQFSPSWVGCAKRLKKIKKRPCARRCLGVTEALNSGAGVHGVGYRSNSRDRSPQCTRRCARGRI